MEPSASGFPALIDEFRLQFHNRITSLLKEFDDFEYEMKRSEKMVEEDRRRKDEYLTEMKRKYPRWTLPASVGAKEQGSKKSKDGSAQSYSQVVQLKAEIDQLKQNFQRLEVRFGNLEKSTDNSQRLDTATAKVDSALLTNDRRPLQLDNARKEEVESVGSEDDRFLELNFASVAKPRFGPSPLRGKAGADARTVEAKSGDNNAESPPPPTRFAFDQKRKTVDDAPRPETIHANEATSADVDDQSSSHSGSDSPDNPSEASSSLSKPPTPHLLEAVARENPSDVNQDDFMAKLFPDKFGVKQRRENSPEDIFALKDDSDSDFFA